MFANFRLNPCYKVNSMELKFKIGLDKRRPKKNLTYPLKLQIYQDQCHKTLSLGIDLLDKDWNDQ
jgi:hypothetical protein